DPSFNSWG
uniref:Kinin-3 n=1 Tax=Periplaneta americana TaxID=6978 RepID=KINI3_PERAM|nr:RecName: Full=Kinin-3; AltName: Full=Pea-K-3 [Periplaneta americana]